MPQPLLWAPQFAGETQFSSAPLNGGGAFTLGALPAGQARISAAWTVRLATADHPAVFQWRAAIDTAGTAQLNETVGVYLSHGETAAVTDGANGIAGDVQFDPATHTTANMIHLGDIVIDRTVLNGNFVTSGVYLSHMPVHRVVFVNNTTVALGPDSPTTMLFAVRAHAPEIQDPI